MFGIGGSKRPKAGDTKEPGKAPETEKAIAPDGFVRVVPIRQVRPGQILEAQAVTQTGKVALALTSVAGTYYAFAAHCPHQGWPLWSGTMEGEMVRCFLHRWQFSVRTGENTAPGGIPVYLPIYPVRLEGDEIWVDVSQPPKKSLPSITG